MATAYVKGLQGKDPKTGVAATIKHFAAHGAPEGGRNIASVHCGPREYREVFLFPFEAAVKRGQAWSLMNAYHELDGVPSASDRSLLTGILREEWGFDGFIVSDYWSIDRLQTIHRTAADKKEAAVQALEAGIDMEIPDLNYYGAPLIQAVKQGMVSQSTVDTAVCRILKAKFELGVFEKPYVSPSSVRAVFDTPELREKTRYAAQQSMVLLKNNGVLPLKKSLKSLAVIGPNSHSKRNIFGDYTYTAHLSEDSDVKAPTILHGIKAAVSKRTDVAYAMGCKLMGDDVSGFKAAVKKAKDAEVVVVVIGERAGLWENDLSGENRDRASLALPGKQEELLEAIIETGTPVVVVLVNGRPLAFPKLIDKCAAIVEAWYPGQAGGKHGIIIIGICQDQLVTTAIFNQDIIH